MKLITFVLLILTSLDFGCPTDPVEDPNIYIDFTPSSTSISVGDEISFDVNMRFGKDAGDVLFILCGQTTQDSDIMKPVRIVIETETEKDSITIFTNAISLTAENLSAFEGGDVATIIWEAVGIGTAIINHNFLANTGLPPVIIGENKSTININ